MKNKIMLTAVMGLVMGSAESAPPTLQETSYVLEHQNRIKSKLKDADSAKFKDSFVSNSMGIPLVCGHVNSKNSFGGYSEFQRFLSGGTIQVIESDMPAGEMDNLWKTACGNK